MPSKNKEQMRKNFLFPFLCLKDIIKKDVKLGKFN